MCTQEFLMMVTDGVWSTKFIVSEYFVIFFLSINSLLLWVRMAQLLFNQYSLIVTGAKMIITVLFILSVIVGIIGTIKYRKFELFVSIFFNLAGTILKVSTLFRSDFDGMDYFPLRVIDIVLNFCYILCAMNFLFVLNRINFKGYNY